MILPAAFALGFALGWWRASARGGNRLDRLQYGAAHGIAFALVALFVTIFIGHAVG
jgi:hypothetical protein